MSPVSPRFLSHPTFPVSSQVPCLTPGPLSHPTSPVSSQVPCLTPGPLSHPTFPVSSQVPRLTPGLPSHPRAPILPQVPVSSHVPCLAPGPLSCPRSLSRPRSPVSPQVPYLAPGPCLIPATGLLQSQPIQDGSGLLCCPRDDAVRCTHMLEEMCASEDLAPGPCLVPGPLSHPRSPVTPHVPCLAPGTSLGLAPGKAGVLTQLSPPPCPLLPAPHCLFSPAAPPEFTHACVKALLFVWGLEILCCELPPLGSSQVPPGSVASPIRPDPPRGPGSCCWEHGLPGAGPLRASALSLDVQRATRPRGANGLLGSDTVSVRTRTWSTGVPISLHPLAAQDGGRLRVTRRRWPDFFQLNLSDVGGEGPGSQSPPYPWQSAECVIVGVSVSRYEYMCVRAWAQRICVSVPELVKACVCMSACM